MADLGYGVRTSPLLRHHSSDRFLCKLKTWYFGTAGSKNGTLMNGVKSLHSGLQIVINYSNGPGDLLRC